MHLLNDLNREDLFNPAHLSVSQADLYSVGMIGRFGKEIFDNPSGQIAGALVFFQHDVDFEARFDVYACAAIHADAPLSSRLLSMWKKSSH
jgi:hypothetical protein